jgi:hypothetical protein
MRDQANFSQLASRAYLNERELAERLNVSVKWLQKMRLSGGGIPYTKFGCAVRYPIRAIEKFEAEALRHSTSDRG